MNVKLSKNSRNSIPQIYPLQLQAFDRCRHQYDVLFKNNFLLHNDNTFHNEYKSMWCALLSNRTNNFTRVVLLEYLHYKYENVEIDFLIQSPKWHLFHLPRMCKPMIAMPYTNWWMPNWEVIILSDDYTTSKLCVAKEVYQGLLFRSLMKRKYRDICNR